MRIAAATVFCGLLLAFLPVSAAKCQEETALDRYVASADPSYHYQLLNTVPGPSYTAYIFRGLLRLYSRYGPSDRSATQGDLCHEAPVPPVTQRNRSSASGPIDNSPGGTLLH